MPAQKKYPDELKERAVQAMFEIREREGKGQGEIARGQLGVHREALWSWRQAESDGGTRPGTTTGDKKKIADLEREVRELRRANEILKAPSAHLPALRLDAPVAGHPSPPKETTCPRIPPRR